MKAIISTITLSLLLCCCQLITAQTPNIIHIPTPSAAGFDDIYKLKNNLIVLKPNSVGFTYYMSKDSGLAWNKTTDYGFPMGYGFGKHFSFRFNNFQYEVSYSSDLVNWESDSTLHIEQGQSISLEPTVFGIKKDLFLINRDSIYISHDSGVVWRFWMMANEGDPDLMSGYLEYDDEQLVLGLYDENFIKREYRIFTHVNDSFQNVATRSRLIKPVNGLLYIDSSIDNHSTVSTDHGITWLSSNLKLNGYTVFLPSENAYFNFTDNLVYRATDGIFYSDYTSSWNSKFPFNDITQKEVQAGNATIRIGLKGVYRSVIPNQWINLSEQIDIYNIRNVVGYKNQLKVYNYNGTTSVSNDRGVSWDISPTANWDTSYFKVSETDYIRYGKEFFNYSINKGATWQSSTIPPTFKSDHIYSIAVWGDWLCMVFNGTNNNPMIGVSYNKGHSIDIRPFPTGGKFDLIACSGDRIIIGGDTGYYISNDFGQSFNHHSNSFDLHSLVTVDGSFYTDNQFDSSFYKFDTITGNFLPFSKVGFHNYATTYFVKSLGILIGNNRYSTNKGVTWTHFQMPDSSMMMNLFFSVEDSVKIYAPTSSGLWRLDFNPVTGLLSFDKVVHQTTFIYPNPGNTGQLYVFNKDNSCNQVEIMDINGQLIYSENLHSQQDYAVVDVTAIRPGIYIVLVHSDNGTTFQKWIRE